MTRKIGIISATMLLTATVAYGLQLKLTLDEIAQTAGLIFIGTVSSQSSRYTTPQETPIQIDVVFRDLQVVHGTDNSRQRAESAITLSYAGGRMGNVTMDVSDTPVFTIGRRYLIFMHDDGPVYLNPVIGGPQGLFEVIKDAVTGQDYVLTAGRRAVLGLDSRGNVQASPVKAAAIRSGMIVADLLVQAEKARAEQPAQGVTDGALAEAPGAPAPLADQIPLTLQSFIERITTESLKRPINHALLNRDGVGLFYREVDGQMRGEAIKITAPPARRLSDMASRHAPVIEAGSIDAAGQVPQTNVDPQGSTLYYCGNRGRPFNMEQVSTSWWEWWVNNNSMWSWNQYVDLYRYIPDDGSFGWRNGTNEFDGYPDNATMQAVYNYTWGASTLAVTISYTINGTCGTIMETDVAWNPAKSRTDNYLFAFNNSGIVNQMPVTLHELGHTHGLQRALGELYDYDLPSAMHAYYWNVAEDGWGVHAADTANTRANYGSSTGVADIGVESYYGSNGLNNSWTNTTLYRPGNTINVNGVTVENMSDYALGNVHIRLYLSTNQTISTGDRLIGDWFWGSFCGPCYNVGNYTTSIPTDTPPGAYWVGAIVTINGYANDGMTSNNATFLPTPINVTCSGTFSMNPFSASFLKGGRICERRRQHDRQRVLVDREHRRSVGAHHERQFGHRQRHNRLHRGRQHGCGAQRLYLRGWRLALRVAGGRMPDDRNHGTRVLGTGGRSALDG